MTSDAAGLLVLGIGNPDRGDDAAGPLAALRLRESAPPGIEVRTLSGEAAGLIDAWAGRRVVFVIDAVMTGSPAGTLHRWDAGEGMAQVEFQQTSSHSFSLGQAIELARALGRLPEKLVIYGIEGARFGLGEPPDAAVLAGVEKTAEAIRREAVYTISGGV